MGKRLDGSAHQARRIQHLQLVRVTALKPCEAQELANNASHALAFFTEQDDVFILIQPFKAGLNNCHRRPEFVCRIGRKPALHFHRFNQPFEAFIDRGDERLNLTWRLANVEQCMRLLWADP